ncbi:hypothetical protein ACF1AJ_02870 [Leifsonia sp. NPDC014704]|uniref:hypothetical protein n=1 Tax=Leifsonia sp. NPDC014704 TaxID=3364123 RepID=UPI0036F49046
MLALLAVALVVQWVTGQGTIGNLTSNAANRGVAFLVVVCVGGATALAAGAGNAVRGHRGLAAIIPLAVLVLIGLVGESIDIASGNPLLDNLIGAAIIAAAAVPLVLLLLPRRLHVDSKEPSAAVGTLP